MRLLSLHCTACQKCKGQNDVFFASSIYQFECQCAETLTVVSRNGLFYTKRSLTRRTGQHSPDILRHLLRYKKRSWGQPCARQSTPVSSSDAQSLKSKCTKFGKSSSKQNATIGLEDRSRRLSGHIRDSSASDRSVRLEPRASRCQRSGQFRASREPPRSESRAPFRIALVMGTVALSRPSNRSIDCECYYFLIYWGYMLP